MRRREEGRRRRREGAYPSVAISKIRLESGLVW
jgi:hypothetical protein